MRGALFGHVQSPAVRRGVLAAVASAALLLSAACSGDGDGDGGASGRPDGSPTASGSASPASPSRSADLPPEKGSAKVVSTLTENLKSPWGLAALPGGDLLVSSRDEGTIHRIDGESGKQTLLGSVPGVAPAGEGGLLGLAVSSTFGADQLVYAYFTTTSDNRIVRMSYDEKRPAGQQLGAPDTVLRGIPKGSIHNGGRIAFGPDKMLYAGTGEAGDTELSQDKESLAGKILRMTPDGEPVHGNPEADSVVYSYGHRNVQGLAWDAEKRLWAAEFGQNTWDELNLIEPGGNYGWPEVEGREGEDGFIDPVAQWKTSEASPSGIAYAEGSIWMAGLRGERLWRIPLSGEKAGEPLADPQAFLEEEHGRLRTVVSAGSDRLWLLTSNTDGRGTQQDGDDRILQVEVE
ncbi:PQQ-dependent sugar dehydrogenase [Streptomyces sp. MBT67]|uniref:PQQ-dependent sugar dehydrogenase n=1 Tax=Streptomyces TaxID=1883 RepID=UPI00190E36AD|nr:MULTISPECIES: PQQ-dependent sugar dehydrogenase [unclassified Streptomyces]MBK3528555.1 PQQ-dependent sugar dehydrogenase [Streptomyces sp. MBT72]MBK3534940.1 PQQ-dependent sugar dehydrogenase [Streptomyces sp. MBT67]MBK3550680.1 PQQ-dependent sugar dehydrogenase [Streptomyces sp. MBT61]MBK6028666.1 PQQ-dependent sugar dehydrogenase [Streptomyces sp. MBT59]